MAEDGSNVQYRVSVAPTASIDPTMPNGDTAATEGSNGTHVEQTKGGDQAKGKKAANQTDSLEITFNLSPRLDLSVVPTLEFGLSPTQQQRFQPILARSFQPTYQDRMQPTLQGRFQPTLQEQTSPTTQLTVSYVGASRLGPETDRERQHGGSGAC